MVKQAKNKKHNSKRKIATKYHIINLRGSLIPVCQKTFLDVLLIKKDRVKGIMSRYYKSGGNHPKENRGGDRKSEKYLPKKLSVQQFIEKFKCEESHYCRSKTQRLYLQPELNIKKMWRLYNAENDSDLRVQQSFFRKIFNTYYNIGFGSPRTDVCSACISLQERIKTERDPLKKQELMTEKRIHRLKYKAFYQILQDNDPSIKIITFDCQKNQALPKLPDQSAYFSRQFNFQHFAIVEGSSKAKLNKENVYSYYWDEVTHNKGGNEIVSAVYDYLKKAKYDDQIKALRVVCDGCSGQNKNTSMIAMLSKWLYCEAPRNLKKVEIIYPVVGHSFIPPDRVFALIEKDLKKQEVVTSPEQYVSVLEKYGRTKALSEVTVFNWKKSYENIIKPTTSWNFPFMKAKRFFLTRTKTENVFVQGETHYKTELNKKSIITKKNKKITMIDPDIIPPHQIIPKQAKLNDVSNLLEKHFGPDWSELPFLDYYNNIRGRMHGVDSIIDEATNTLENLCEHGFEDNLSHV